MYVALNRVIEARYCHVYYSKHDPSAIGDDGVVEETRCKIDIVQEQLASLQDTIETILVICGEYAFGIMVTLLSPRSCNVDPFREYFRQFGRRLVLCLNTCGLAAMVSWIIVVGTNNQFKH